MQLSDSTFGWNELDFLDLAEFRQMGPPIVKLEIDRLGRLIDNATLPIESSDRLRRARFELIRFVETIESLDGIGSLKQLSFALTTALLNIGFPTDSLDSQDAKEIKYVTDRLSYIHNRMELIY